MKSKTILITILLSLNVFLATAQETNSYYFKDFTSGQVLLKNKQFARGKFNYDFVNRQMHFLNGSTDMIVENLEDIDTILIDKTRFIPYDGRFVEVMKGQKAVLLVEKSINTQEHGKVGAMGVATHGSVQVIDVNTRFQRVNGNNNTDLTVYKTGIRNTYLIQVKKDWKSFQNQATFLKLFPKKEHETIKKRLKEADIDFNVPDQVLGLLDMLEIK